MPAVPFAQLPGDARLWVFAAARPLTPDQSEMLLSRAARFLDGWHAHGRPVTGAAELRYNQFLLVGADERASGVSGCSIDSLFHALQATEGEIGTTLTDSSLVWFRGADGSVRSVPRGEFRQHVREGEAGDDTIVFDNTVATAAALREGKWELPMRDSWHGKAFAAGAAGGRR